MRGWMFSQETRRIACVVLNDHSYPLETIRLALELIPLAANERWEWFELKGVLGDALVGDLIKTGVLEWGEDSYHDFAPGVAFRQLIHACTHWEASEIHSVS